MAAPKGHEFYGGGRPKGSKSRKTLFKTREVLEQLGLSPVEELIKLLPELEAKDKARVWQYLNGFVDAPLKSAEAPPPADDLAGKTDDELRAMLTSVPAA